MLAALLTNKYIFGIVMLLSLIIMMREFLKMTCGKNYWFSQILSILAGATLFTLIYLYKGFNYPGKLVILAFVVMQAMNAGDIPFIMGYNMFLAVLSVLGVLLADLMYAVVDPRVKLT